MSITDDLLIILNDYSGGYKLMRQRIAGYSGPSSDYIRSQHCNIKDQTLRTTLSRLRKRNLVENKKGIWSITKKGKDYLKNNLSNKIRPHFKYKSYPKNRKRNMIIAFDIPEFYRKKRDWLRVELLALGFIPLQKSVWFGPAPVPEEFIRSVGDLNLIKFIKFFKATEEDIV